jgi:hypothetical protein
MLALLEILLPREGADKFWLRLQGWQAVRQKFGWQFAHEDYISVVVEDNGTSGIQYRFASLSNQPLKIACLVTMTFVFEASYTLTSLLLNTVMYPASANLAVLMSKLVGMWGQCGHCALVDGRHSGGGKRCWLVFLFCQAIGKFWTSNGRWGCRLAWLCPSLCQS